MKLREILLLFFCVLLGCAVVITYQFVQNTQFKQKKLLTPLPQSEFSMQNPPTDSIDGLISTISGQVQWESRIATMPATLYTGIPIEQGESVNTKKTGSLELSFPQIGTFQLQNNTQLNIIQTLPTSAVFEQPAGNVTYTKIGKTPLAIKSLGLLIQLSSGVMSITTDSDRQMVTVDLTDGSAQTAYVNSNNTSSVQDLHPGDKYIFNDTTAVGKVE